MVKYIQRCNASVRETCTIIRGKSSHTSSRYLQVLRVRSDKSCDETFPYKSASVAAAGVSAPRKINALFGCQHIMLKNRVFLALLKIE